MGNLNELALFAGAGGGILGGQLLGWRTVCAVECNAYAASVLCARQNDGLLPPFPIWDDVCTFDGRPWRGIVDVVSGGFPCQDISVAGGGAGIDGERSGLWGEMARTICEVRPGNVYVENSPALTSRGLHRVLGDLAALGYDAEWGVLGAADVGAPHQRDRIWILATNADNKARSTEQGREHERAKMFSGSRTNKLESINKVADADSFRELQQERLEQEQWRRPGYGREDVADTVRQGPPKPEQEWEYGRPATDECGWWATEPDVGRVANGVAARVDRLTALGNGQVPACAAEAFIRLTLER